MTALLAGAAIGALGVLAVNVFACSCLKPPPPLVALEASSAVFVGLVLDVDGPYPIPFGYTKYAESDRRFRLQVLASWKGAERETIVVRTGRGGGDCGYDFKIGDVYLVFADQGRIGSGDTVWTSICTRTSAITYAAEDSIALDKPLMDRTNGRSWLSYRPGSVCPLHRDYQVKSGRTVIAFGLTRRVAKEYEALRGREFPYAGLQIDRPPVSLHDPMGTIFRSVGPAFVCPACRILACHWCQQHGGKCSESDDEDLR